MGGAAARRRRFGSTAGRLMSLLPFAVACTAIFFVSSLPKPPIPPVLLFPHADKLLHAAAYGALAILASWGTVARPGAHPRQVFRRLQPRLRQRYGVGMRSAFLLSLGYGIVDECHQAFVPGRSASFADWLADGLGAATALIILHLWRTRGGSKAATRASQIQHRTVPGAS